MSQPEEPQGETGSIHLEAEAAGNATVIQVGRDQHLHLQGGVRCVISARSAGAADECPYPGLAAFDSAQAQWFFGRGRLTADLLGHLNDCFTDGGPMMVVAPSGAGKSSLLQAGLLHAVTRGAFSGDWLQLLFTPTAHPMREAAAHIAELAGELDGAALPECPQADQLTELLRRKLRGHAKAETAATTRAVIVVDQLEELFTLCADEQERREFIDWLWSLAEAGTQEGPLALVVCGLRADFYAECANYPLLRQALQAGQTLVGPMSQDELREAIVCPAQVVGLDIEAGLVELLLRDMGSSLEDDTSGVAGNYDAGRLPLLAHALQATWQQRHGSMLTVDGYRTTGGIRHAIATTAERAFNRLDFVGQEDARAMFLRLVKIGDSGEDTRRHVSREDLLADSRRPDVARTVLDAYTRTRMVTQTQDTVEITHEALIRAWPRLRQWIDEDRAGNLIRQELEESAAIWNHDHRDKGALYRGSRLDAARRWGASPNHGDLSPTASDFLTASNQNECRTVRVRRGAVASLAILALLASYFAISAHYGQAAARAERDKAISGQVAAEAESLSRTNVSLAAQLDAVAYRMRPTPDIYTSLLSMENTPLSTPLECDAQGVDAIAFSHDGRILATSARDGLVKLWDVADPARARRLGSPLIARTGKRNRAVSVNALAFDPRGQILASGLVNGTITLWNLSDPVHPSRTELTPLRPSYINSLAFSANGQLLASGSADGTIQLWNLADPARPVALGLPFQSRGGAIHSVAFSPDGLILATGDRDGIRLWRVGDPTRPVFAGLSSTDSSTIESLDFSPNGHTLASGGFDDTVRLWNVIDPGHLTEVGQPTNTVLPVESVAFSPDGQALASSNGSQVQMWSVGDPNGANAVGLPLTGHTGPVTSVAFSPAGRTLASGSADGTTRLWAIPPDLLIGQGGVVNSVAFSPHGHILADGSHDGAIQLWNVADPASPAPLGQPIQGDAGEVISVAFSPDGQILASGNANGTVHLWNIADPVRPESLGQPLRGHRYSGPVSSVAFSPHGHLLASGSDGWVRMWDVADPGRAAYLGALDAGNNSGTVFSVAFSPIGHVLAAGADDGYVALWDVAHARQTGMVPIYATMATNAPGVFSVAFSPSGTTLASGSYDDAVRLWRVADPARPTLWRQPLTGPNGPVFSLAFSPNGRLLASGSFDGSVRLWDVTNPARAAAVGQPWSESYGYVQSLAFSPDGRILASSTEDGSVRLSPTSAVQAIQWICTAIPEALTRQQWQQYVPGLPYNPPCGQGSGRDR